MAGFMSLPDELLDTVITEVQLVHATRDGRDFEAYQRRDTNRRKQDVASLARTCKRLNGLSRDHLVKIPPSPGTARSLVLREQDMQNLRLASFESLKDLAVLSQPDSTTRGVQQGFGAPVRSSSLQEIIRAADTLETLVLADLPVYDHMRQTSDVAKKLFRTLASLEKLRHLTITNLRIELPPVDHRRANRDVSESLAFVRDWERATPFNHALIKDWQAPLTRLEIAPNEPRSLAWFALVMQYFAATLEIAILRAPTDGVASTPLSRAPTRNPSAELGALWRLEFAIGSTSDVDAPRTFRSLIALWKRAPRLAVLVGSARMRVTDKRGLEEVASLLKEKKLEYARLPLETGEWPEGDGPWAEEIIQEIRIG